MFGIFLFVIVRYMDKSDQYDGSIAEQEKIIGISIQQEQKVEVNKKVKFATVNQIRKLQRNADIQNKKLIQQNPTLFDGTDISQRVQHFVSNQSEQYFLSGNKKEQVDDVIEMTDKKWEIKINISNVLKQSILTLQLNQMKKNRIFTIESYKSEAKRGVGFRYTLKMGDGTLALRVWIELEGEFKIWKEMQIPSPQQPIIVQIHSFNNQQTNLKINDFIFHLILKMPYFPQTHYCLTHDGCVSITKLQIETIAEQKQFGSSETNCSNQCQLI